jgi:uncharacterized protein YoxC
MTNDCRKNLRLPPAVGKRIEEVAENRGLNQNELVAELVKNTLGVDKDNETYLRNRSEDLAEREQRLREEIQTHVEALQDVRDQQREVRERLKKVQEERRELTEIFDDILEDMQKHPEKTIEAYKTSITEAIRVKHESGPTETKRDDIIVDLRSREADRDDISIAAERFTPGATAGQQPTDSEDSSQGPELKSMQKLSGGEINDSQSGA